MLENRCEPRGEKLQDFASRINFQREESYPDWLNDVKAGASDLLKSSGFPHSKIENWEFSQVRKVLAESYDGADTEAETDKIRKILDRSLLRTGLPALVFVNGSLALEYSDTEQLPEGVKIVSAASMQTRPDQFGWTAGGSLVKGATAAFSGLNLLLMKDPALLFIEPGTKAEQEVQLVFISIGNREHRLITNPAVYVYGGVSSEASIIETHVGSEKGKYLSNSTTVISAGEGCRLNHVKIISENEQGYHFSSIKADVARQAFFKTHTIVQSGKIVRNEVETKLKGEGAAAELFGLYLTDGNRQVENSTVIEHLKPECTSREHYKGILNDESRAVFRGRIVVAEDAQKTDSRQKNDNLLLSDSARINSKPQLEIYADDVSCTHGATVGQLEDEKIFYLQSRGISRQEAGALLIKAFGNEIISGIDSEKIRLVLEEELLSILARN